MSTRSFLSTSSTTTSVWASTLTSRWSSTSPEVKNLLCSVRHFLLHASFLECQLMRRENNNQEKNQEKKMFVKKSVNVTTLIFLFSVFLFPEANPEKFNSRFRNKMFYAGVSEHTHTHTLRLSSHRPDPHVQRFGWRRQWQYVVCYNWRLGLKPNL